MFHFKINFNFMGKLRIIVLIKDMNVSLYLERSFEGFNAFHGSAQAFLEFGQLAAQVGVVAHQLLVHFRQLLQVVL